MNRDRGRIKWTAMMLPEHVEKLREWQATDEIPLRQIPDEQQLDEWDYLITSAIEKNTPLAITYWPTDKPICEIGHIHHFDFVKQKLRLLTMRGERRIQLNQIESISEIE